MKALKIRSDREMDAYIEGFDRAMKTAIEIAQAATDFDAPSHIKRFHELQMSCFAYHRKHEEEGK